MTRSIKRLPLALACALLASTAGAAPPVAAPSAAAAPASSMLGFTDDRAAAQRSLEQRFDAANAVRRVPVAADEIAIAIRHDLIVRAGEIAR